MDIKLNEIYDRFASTYEENRALFDMTGIFDSFFESLNKTNGKLLDLGCGAGEPIPKLFIDNNWKVTGVDFSSKMLNLASKYTPQMERIHSDITKMEFKENKFDAITAIYSLFHIESSKHENLFKNIYKWLKPNGKALFTYATKEYTGQDEFNGYKEFLGENLFYSHKTPNKLYEMLENIGFVIKSKDYKNIGGEVFLWVTIEKVCPSLQL